MRGMTSVVVLCDSRFLLILIVICYAIILGFFGFRTSVVSSRFIIMRFSSSGADPAVQCICAHPNRQTAAMRTCVRACVLLSARVRAHVTGVNELIQRLFLHVLHLLLHPGLHAQHSRSRDNDAAESHKQTHYAGRRQDTKHTPSSKRASSRGSGESSGKQQ